MSRTVCAALRLLWPLALGLAPYGCARGGPPAAGPLTTLRELREVEQAAAGAERSVDVRGMVTYFDAEQGLVYLQDATGAAAVEVGVAPVVAGESVRLTGTLRPSSLPRLLRPRLTVLGRSGQERMPEPRLLGAEALASGAFEAEWVELHGVVRSVQNAGGLLSLEVSEAGRRFRVAVLGAEASRYLWLVDFRISVRGVRARAATRPSAVAAELLVPELGHLRLEEDPAAEPFALPAVSVKRLVHMPAEALPEHRVHVLGSVGRLLDERRFVLNSEGLDTTVASQEPLQIHAGEEVELVGFAALQQGALVIEEAGVRSGTCSAAPEAPLPSLPVLATAAEVRRLSPSEAQRGYPVRLRAIVTYNDPDRRLLFVQDPTAGIYVEAFRHIHHVEAGDVVEIEGRSSPGAFAPIVDHPKLRVVAHGPLPPAQRVPPEQLLSGQQDSQWIEVEGVVRGVTGRRRAIVVRLAAGGIRFPVEMPGPAPADLAARLVNARVSLRAIPRSVLTRKGQLADVTLHSPGLEAFHILTPPSREPFALPITPIHSLLHFVPGQSWEHRVRVQGVAIYSAPGELYIRDDGAGLALHGELDPLPAVGDEVDAIGFAAPGEYGPVLQDAELRVRRSAVSPRPTAITPEQALSGQFAGELVQLEARLLESVDSPEGVQLSLQAGPYLFTALRRGSPSWPGALRPGSLLRLTGVCVVSADEERLPQAFRLLLREPADAVVLRPGPWWTPRRTAFGFAAMAGLVGLALAWILTLRRRVRAQSLIIWRRVKRETELQERQRMARELHDTLEQNLTGISLSLEAASLTLGGAPQMAEQHLSRALGQVEASMAEVHRAVWGLREESLDARGLPACLDEIGQQLASCSPSSIEVHTSVAGSPRPFALAVENGLLRIGQEALTNAVKHGHAAHIQVRLSYGAEAFELRVKDDGHGFDMGGPTASGHFGLLGMRERAEEIGAHLELRSAPGRGTEVEVTLPGALSLRRTG
jgi:signal transduction histidine kinase